MGMTIDKAIAELELLKKNTFSYMSAHQAFITAIDIMRKYQKIEEILKDDYEKDCGDKADFFRIGDIRMTINGESR